MLTELHATSNATVLPAVSITPSTLEDPLAYLPCSAISEYRKGGAIYTYGQSSTGIDLVVKGNVKILRQTSRAGVVVHVYGPNEFFGESALRQPRASHRGSSSAWRTLGGPVLLVGHRTCGADRATARISEAAIGFGFGEGPQT